MRGCSRIRTVMPSYARSVLGRLGVGCVRRHRLVLTAWLLLVVVGFGFSGLVFDRLVPTRGGAATESILGYELLTEASPYDGRVVAGRRSLR